jgi:hypothetical protein
MNAALDTLTLAITERVRSSSVCLVAIACSFAILVAPSPASAQETTRGSIMWDVTKNVLRDPTTYAPAVMSYDSQRRDWVTSQVLFRQGWLEVNPHYTTSGLPNDVPLSYGDGNARIRNEALRYFAQSAFNNIGATIVERSLSARYPEHRTLFRTLSWIERISVASYVSYLASVDHFRQAERNRVMATKLGY